MATKYNDRQQSDYQQHQPSNKKYCITANEKVFSILLSLFVSLQPVIFQDSFDSTKKMYQTLHKRLLSMLMAAYLLLTAGCLANPDEGNLNTDPPEAYRKAQTPVVAAYLHIGNRVLNVRQIDLEGVDILNMAFTVIKNNHIGLLHPSDAQNFHVARSLKHKYPNLKVLMSVGGQGTEKVFTQMAGTKANRDVFVDDAVRFVRSYGLDGIDVDWEFPGMKKATRAADRTNFTALLSELRAAFDEASRKDGKKYYVTVASGAFEQYLSYIEPLKITPSVDYFFIMTYDFHGQWNEFTGHHTNLFAPSGKPRGHSVARIVDMYVSKGIPKSKIIIGAAFYGRKWTGVEPHNNSVIYQAGKGVGSVSYRNITSLLNPNTGYRRYWDRQAYAPYIYNRNEKIFISYDDKESVSRKVDYVFIHDLGGIMYWEHFSDANHNELSRAIVNEMSLRKSYKARIRLPGGYIAKKIKK
jgi:GH18 family chitinase